MLPAMIDTTRKFAITAVTALAVALPAAVPAQAGIEKEDFLKGVAAALIVGALIRQNDGKGGEPRVVYIDPKPYPQPHPQPGYGGSVYRTPAAQAFNSYSASERRLIQKRLAAYGYYRGGIDGSFGPGTYNAVVAYARDTGSRNQIASRNGAFELYDALIF